MVRIISVTAIVIALGSTAFAGGHNPGEARAMAKALKTYGGGNNSELKSILGLSGNGGVASFVSGNKSVLGTTGTGGWGNIGSLLTAPDGDGGVTLSLPPGDGQSVSGR